jgi:hypothetical protein
VAPIAIPFTPASDDPINNNQINANQRINMPTGNGKIANLPSNIRDELNYRLNDGEPGSELVEWLNAKPEVIKVVTERFDGHPISEQNLSQWRTHGYRQWHAYRVILDELGTTSEHTEEIAATGIDFQKLRLSLTASYAEMLQRWIITPTDEMTYKLAVFKNITNAVATLHRTEIQDARIEIENRRLDLLGEKQRNKSGSASASSEAIGRGAGVGAGGCPGKGGGLGKSRASQEACHSTDKSASSPRETPSAENASIPSPVHPNAPRPPRSESPAPPHGKPAPQNAAPPSPAAHSAPSAPPSQAAPRPQPSGNRPAAPPIAAPVAPFHPSTRPGGPPRNATPRNPFALL